MNSPSPISLFARKGNATPTPVPEDRFGFTGNSLNETKPPAEDAPSTVVTFEPNKSTDAAEPENQTEAGSMLDIQLTPRQNDSAPPVQEADPAVDESPSASASVSALALPDNKALVVIDASDIPDTQNLASKLRLGFAGKWRAAILLSTILAAILAGTYFYVAARAPEPTPDATIIPTKPALLEIPAKFVAPTVPVPEMPKASVQKPPGLYSIQLGSLVSYRDAERELKTIRQRYGNLLSGLELRVVSGAVTGKGRVWRIRAAGLSSVESAERACRRLGAQINSCLVLGPR